MKIRKAAVQDAHTVGALMQELWPGHTLEEMEEEAASLLQDVAEAAVFLAEGEAGAAGFAQCQLRHDYVEGCSTSPVGYLEGVYVRPAARRQKIGGQLVAACEQWARDQGCTEMGSDCEQENQVSLAFHLKQRYQVENRVICFIKKL